MEEKSESPDETGDNEPVESDPPSAADDDAVPASDPEDSNFVGTEAEDGPSVFCNQCGWENPPGAQFCSRCGEELQDLSDASPAGTRRVSADLPTGSEPDESEDTESGTASDDTETDEQGAMGRQIALVVGGALALVLGLFFVTQWSNQQKWGSSSSSNSPSAEAGAGGSSPTSSRPPGEQSSMGASGQQRGEGSLTDLRTLLDQTADSLTGPTAAQIDSLRSRVEQASGTNKRQLQAELVNLYIGAGYPGRATLVQRELADATGTVDAQRRSADLLYRWMQKLQQQGQRKQIIQVARHASKAYARVVEQRPDDLDARTRMGEAYLLTNKPMRGIEAINAVLDDDSTFVPARFQKGLALLQINRLDQSMEQFRRVKRYAEDGSSFYRRAEQALKIIKQRRSDASSGGAAPPGADS